MNGGVELLAPAGDPEKLRIAVKYGADAVYLAGSAFGLRAACGNFDDEALREGVAFAHSHGVKVYVTLNALPRNDEIRRLPPFIRLVADCGADAVIVSDLGVLELVKQHAPGLEIHISTQASAVNFAACRVYHGLGARRIILARELSLPEIADIRRSTPQELSLECFVHGAMCVSYSGRCLMSQYMTGRDANRGDCAQPCRWKYALMEEKRPGEYFPVYEDETGTFLYNARDLCLIGRLPELLRAGVTSLKIEGRAKSSYYLACVLKAYRQALDACLQNPEGYAVRPEWLNELYAVSHRPYCEGFLDGRPDGGQIYENSSYVRDYDLCAVVEGYDEAQGLLICSQRNRFFRGDELELLTPRGPVTTLTADELYDGEGNAIAAAPHPTMRVLIPFDRPVEPDSMLRKRKTEK